MPRRIAWWLAFAAAATGLIRLVWPGAAASPAALINRVDVIAAVALLAGLPWLVRRRFGPPGDSWLARTVRLAGYAAVFTLVLVKAEVERSEFARLPSRAWVAGAWAGEVIFLAVTAAYVAGLLAATARRPPFSPVALAIGTGAGAAAGLVMYALPPLGSRLHITTGWLADGYDVARVLAVPVALGAVIAAGLAAARRTGQRRRLPLADARARQGLAAGLCAGAAAGLLFCVLSTGTVALLPHAVKPLLWVFSSEHARIGLVNYNKALYQFEMSAADTEAGYLIALVCFPLFGAGLGAWGGLYAADPGQRPGGGGGGGGGPEPGPEPPPPDGGRRIGDDRQPTVLRGNYLIDFPVTGRVPDDGHAAPEPGRIPVGVSYPPQPSRET
jgi:hypothetical protein